MNHSVDFIVIAITFSEKKIGNVTFVPLLVCLDIHKLWGMDYGNRWWLN
jgi:hypothetical protein